MKRLVVFFLILVSMSSSSALELVGTQAVAAADVASRYRSNRFGLIVLLLLVSLVWACRRSRLLKSVWAFLWHSPAQDAASLEQLLSKPEEFYMSWLGHRLYLGIGCWPSKYLEDAVGILYDPRLFSCFILYDVFRSTIRHFSVIRS